MQKPRMKTLILYGVISIILVLGIGAYCYWYFSETKIVDDTGMFKAYLISLQLACEKGGGTMGSIVECGGSKSQVCTFPDGQACYVENVKDGKCTGTFSPRVLCDNDQENSRTAAESLQSCKVSADCVCGVKIDTRECFYGNKKYVDTLKQCPDFCSGYNGKMQIKCINNLCTQVSGN